jgi:hypothetical protein
MCHWPMAIRGHEHFSNFVDFTLKKCCIENDTGYKINQKPGCEDEKKDGPLKEGIVHHIVDNVAEQVPLALHPGLLHAGAAPDQYSPV